MGADFAPLVVETHGRFHSDFIQLFVVMNGVSASWVCRQKYIKMTALSECVFRHQGIYS